MNKRIQRFAGAAAAAAAVAAMSAAFCSGCESADSYAISVKPGDATVTSAAPSVALTASGWSDYQWSLSDTSLGYLSSSKGQSVVYTARSGTFAGGRQTVTVVAVGSGTSGSATNSAAGGYTAQAIVTHRDETVVETGTAEETTPSSTTPAAGPSTPSGETPTPTPAESPSLSLKISPTSKTVTSPGEDFWISVTDPSAEVSYAWKASAGSLSQSSGPNTFYTTPADAVRGGTATVTCTATRSGYTPATAVCTVLFNVAASTNAPAQ